MKQETGRQQPGIPFLQGGEDVNTNITLENIQALARTIRAETGLYVSFKEDMHVSATVATVSIQHQDGSSYWHEWFSGCTAPSQSESTLEEMERQLADWLATYRKGGEAV